jgi:nucleotide-binding universal stress UspA family protein
MPRSNMADFTVLVPLDTTEFAESSLLALPALAMLGFKKARLVIAHDPKQGRAKEQALSRPALEDYLQGQSARVQALGLETETEVLEGDAADSILAAAAKPDVDLILLATHGRTGIARLRLGSVGDKVIKNSSCPRLVIGPNVEIDLAEYSLKRILLPLDGSELAELSLPIVRFIAQETGAQVDLLQSVSVTPVAGDATVASVDLLTPAMEGAEAYLDRVSSSLPSLMVTKTVVAGSPGQSILDHLREQPVDLVIMCSRGRTGLMRAAMARIRCSCLSRRKRVVDYSRPLDRRWLNQQRRRETLGNSGESKGDGSAVESPAR